MCDINWPKSMDSGCGRKPYWSGGIAFATATDKPLRAAKCLAYSPATPEGVGPAARGERATKNSGVAAHSVRVFITPPQKSSCCQCPMAERLELIYRKTATSV